MISKIILFVLLFTPYLFATTLQEDIAMLRTTPKQNRYKIMNMIKLKLSKMNAHQRAQMVQKLFKVIKSKQHNQHSKYTSEHIMMKKEKSSKMIHLDKSHEHIYKNGNMNFNQKIMKDKNFDDKIKNNFKDKQNNHAKQNHNRNPMKKGR